MSTSSKYRLLLAAVAVLLAVGLVWQKYFIAAVACIVVAVLLLPMLYRWLHIESVGVQVLSPLVFVLVAFTAFLSQDALPSPYASSLSTTYTPPAVTTTTATTSSTKFMVNVFRTENGIEYHFDMFCANEKVYTVTKQQAIDDGLVPCAKCTGW